MLAYKFLYFALLYINILVLKILQNVRDLERKSWLKENLVNLYINWKLPLCTLNGIWNYVFFLYYVIKLNRLSSFLSQQFEWYVSCVILFSSNICVPQCWNLIHSLILFPCLNQYLEKNLSTKYYIKSTDLIKCLYSSGGL